MRHLGIFAAAIVMTLSAGKTNAELVGTVAKNYDGDTFALCDQSVCIAFGSAASTRLNWELAGLHKPPLRSGG